MCAQVLKFLTAKAIPDNSAETTGQPIVKADAPVEARIDTSAMQFWDGASGTRYIHTVHSLQGCPELPAVNYLLVHRDASGSQNVLGAGHTLYDAPSLNLAEIRKIGASLGANEVHVHMLADNPTSAKVIEYDLKQAQLGETLPPTSTSAH